jgi:hypothetical protein
VILRGTPSTRCEQPSATAGCACAPPEATRSSRQSLTRDKRRSGEPSVGFFAAGRLVRTNPFVLSYHQARGIDLQRVSKRALAMRSVDRL